MVDRSGSEFGASPQSRQSRQLAKFALTTADNQRTIGTIA